MSLLSDERGLHLLVLDILCLRELGPEFITYEPETLFSEMRRRFGKLGRVTSEKLLACQVLHSNNLYWTEWEAFEKVTASISGEVAIFSYVQPPDPEEAAVSLTTAGQFADHEYSDEVLRYLASVCLHSGLFYLEGPLAVALPQVQEYVAGRGIEVNYSTVADLLRRTTSMFPDPDSVEEVQVNKVLSIRSALKDFEKETAAQLKRITR